MTTNGAYQPAIDEAAARLEAAQAQRQRNKTNWDRSTARYLRQDADLAAKITEAEAALNAAQWQPHADKVQELREAAWPLVDRIIASQFDLQARRGLDELYFDGQTYLGKLYDRPHAPPSALPFVEARKALDRAATRIGDMKNLRSLHEAFGLENREGEKMVARPDMAGVLLVAESLSSGAED